MGRVDPRKKAPLHWPLTHYHPTCVAGLALPLPFAKSWQRVSALSAELGSTELS